jgi:hypothetical protein
MRRGTHFANGIHFNISPQPPLLKMPNVGADDKADVCVQKPFLEASRSQKLDFFQPSTSNAASAPAYYYHNGPASSCILLLLHPSQTAFAPQR